MSNPIRTYADLLEERKRLEAVLVIQKGIIRQDVLDLKEELKPAFQLLSVVGKVTKGKNNPIIPIALNVAEAIFLRKSLLSGGAKITQLVVPFVAKKLSGYLSKGSGSFLRKLAGWAKGRPSNGHAA